MGIVKLSYDPSSFVIDRPLTVPQYFKIWWLMLLRISNISAKLHDEKHEFKGFRNCAFTNFVVLIHAELCQNNRNPKWHESSNQAIFRYNEWRVYKYFDYLVNLVTSDNIDNFNIKNMCILFNVTDKQYT